jgi:hypothetical protein
VWPTTFVLAGAYLDQLERGNGLDSARIGTVRSELARAQGLTGQGRRDALTQLASQLEGDASRSPAAAKVRTLAGVVRDLATAGG